MANLKADIAAGEQASIARYGQAQIDAFNADFEASFNTAGLGVITSAGGIVANDWLNPQKNEQIITDKTTVAWSPTTTVWRMCC